MGFISDKSDRMLALLEQIAANTSDIDVEGGDQVTINAGQQRQRSSRYFSTGENRLAVEKTGDSFAELEFGFVAKVINLRTTDDVVISFTDPAQNPGGAITIRSNESPFTIGGDVGINTDTLWIQQADSASGTPGVEVIAYK